MDDGFQIIENMGVNLPDDATLIDASEFKTSWLGPDDTDTQRLVMDVNGHNVQIIRYDFSEDVSVMIDGGRIDVMPVDILDSYIRSRT